MSKSFCRGKYLKKNVAIMNQCVCCDYYHCEIGRVMVYKAYKPKMILRALNALRISNKRFNIKNSITEYINDDFLKCLNPNKKYIIYVSKAGIGSFDVYTYEDAKKMNMVSKKRKDY